DLAGLAVGVAAIEPARESLVVQAARRQGFTRPVAELGRHLIKALGGNPHFFADAPAIGPAPLNHADGNNQAQAHGGGQIASHVWDLVKLDWKSDKGGAVYVSR